MLDNEETKTTSIDEILNDAPAEQDAPGAAQPPEPVEPSLEVATDEPEPALDENAGEPPASPNDWTYAAYTDEKAKRQAAEKRAAELEARQKAWEYQQSQMQKPVEAPDVFADPDAYTQHIQQQALAPVLPVIQTLQRQLAAQVHGADKLESATAWFNSLPPEHQNALDQHYGNTPDPYAGLIAEFDKAQIAKEFSDPNTIAQFKAWQASQGQGAPVSQPAQVVSPAPKPSQVQLQPSVMSAPSVGSRSGPKWAGPTPLDNILPE